PPCTGCLVGFIAFDAVRYCAQRVDPPPDEVCLPVLSMLLAQDVLVHVSLGSSVLLVSNSLYLDARPDAVDAAHDESLARLEAMRERLRRPLATAASVYETVREVDPKARTAQLDYERAVREAVDDIIDGEIFQVVPSQRFSLPTAADPLDVYRVLRRMNPSPYMYLLRTADADGTPIDVVGASPESLVTVRGDAATTHP